MSLFGYLAEYSLAEVCNFIYEDTRTGVLSIAPELDANLSVRTIYDLGFQSGRIVYVINRQEIDGRKLLNEIQRRRWIEPGQIASMAARLPNLTQPLGTYLKSQNILDSYRLKLLFDVQVVTNACQLFEIQQGKFKFYDRAVSLYAVMTGLSLPGNELALVGLRRLKNWHSLSAKLPDPEIALQRLFTEIHLDLDERELQVWQLASGEMSLVRIAQTLNLSLEKVRQIAFGLIALRAVHEVAAPSSPPPVNNSQQPIDKSKELPLPIARAKANPVSTSFLGSLMGFLKKKE